MRLRWLWHCYAELLAEARGQSNRSVFEPRNGFDSVRVVLCVCSRRKKNPSQHDYRGSPAEFVLSGSVCVALRLCAPLPPGWGAGNGLQRVGHWQAVATENSSISFSGAPKRGRGRGQLL